MKKLKDLIRVGAYPPLFHPNLCRRYRNGGLIFVFISLAIFAATGCTAILEGDKTREDPHSAQPYERPPELTVEVSNYDELKGAVLDFVMEHEISGEITIHNYDGGDIQEDVDRACGEIMFDHPIGAYAVTDITGLVSKIISYYEISVSIEYKRTKQQIDEVFESTVSTQRYLRTELLSVMREYLEEAVFRTTLNITAEDIIEFVRETYYQNPRVILMLPVTAVEIYPPAGEDRIFELHFGNFVRPDILSGYSLSLALNVRFNALTAGGDNDVEILISLAENLMAACVYDEGMARTISEHGAQNLSATAYGALVNGSAVGEGFAMAYKALCDELGFDCQVVLGYLKGMLHAWNIISLYGHSYHIDVSMCAVDGMETAFLKTDADFAGNYYYWNTAETVKCSGPLRYEDFVEVEPPEEDEEDEEPTEPGEETGEDTDGEKGEENGGEPGEETGEDSGEESGEGSDEENGGENDDEETDPPDEQDEDDGEESGLTDEDDGEEPEEDE